jgi:uncharacterized repeat protein (TIGR03803 family)
MNSRWWASIAARVLAAGMILLCNVIGAQAGERVILRFNKTEGSHPSSALISDAAGNLYGTTTAGGEKDCGTVFELSPSSGGQWTEKVLYSFRGCTQVTLTPRGSMAIDPKGNLFGVQVGYSNSGQIFELKKGTNGAWSYSVIYVFGSNGSSEGSPNTDLVWDSVGNLYGTTASEFGTINGEVFELSPQPSGIWKENVLYTFPAPNGVGYPVAGVTFDNKGNLYGGAFYGSNGAFGAVYELSPQANGKWNLSTLYNFTPATGSELNSQLIFDASGNLYGTTRQLNTGVVFQLSPTSSGTWKEKTIYTFRSGGDGNWPLGLVVDSNGNLYGSTSSGGRGCNGFLCGVVYRLRLSKSNSWNEAILHNFESAEDGSGPGAGLLLDNAGHLYGTTYYGGGRYGYGTVFEVTP